MRRRPLTEAEFKAVIGDTPDMRECDDPTLPDWTIPDYRRATKRDPRRLDRQREAIVRFVRAWEHWDRAPPPRARALLGLYARALWSDLEGILLALESYNERRMVEEIEKAAKREARKAYRVNYQSSQGGLTHYCDGYPLPLDRGSPPSQS